MMELGVSVREVGKESNRLESPYIILGMTKRGRSECTLYQLLTMYQQDHCYEKGAYYLI